jgi:hypothetical protein
MKLLSFDVGIKNLAYCLIDDEKNTIEDWGILNISVDPVCDHVMKGLKSCDKTAKVVIDQTKICASHQKLKCYRDKSSKKIPKTKNALFEMGKRIVRCLDEKPNFLETDRVLIENQPALKNPTMKSVQMMVYTYFLVRGVTSESSPMEALEMVNARNKLKAYKGPPVECEIKDKYKRTKFLGIQYCGKMIQENESIEEKFKILFKNSKKKDDLADAYLQGIYWIEKDYTTK